MTFNPTSLSSWLPAQAMQAVVARNEAAWQALDSDSGPSTFATVQNEAMLTKFFLEQAFNPFPPDGLLLQIIERDFGGLTELKRQWLEGAESERVDWLVVALSFADFRFHLFPIGGEQGTVPFCISAIACGCTADHVVRLSGMGRQEFLETQWDHIDWQVVGLRLQCLEQPLDLLGEPTDCLTEDCSLLEADKPALSR